VLEAGSIRLAKEYPGILNWLLDGCINWQKFGLARPANVQEATDALRRNNDRLAYFYEAMCEIEEGATVAAQALYDCYRRWHDQQPSAGEADDGADVWTRRWQPLRQAAADGWERLLWHQAQAWRVGFEPPV